MGYSNFCISTASVISYRDMSSGKLGCLLLFPIKTFEPGPARGKAGSQVQMAGHLTYYKNRNSGFYPWREMKRGCVLVNLAWI